MKIIAMVPIKLNSQRVVNKNIREFHDGTPLIQFILRALVETKEIDEVYVYCSDEKIKEYLIDGVKFLKRPAYLDEDTSNCNDIISCFIKEVEGDCFVVSHTTSPFTKSESISRCIEAVVSDNEYDCAFTVEAVKNFMWSNGKPINFDPSAFPRTQDLDPIYVETSGAFVFSREVFETYQRRIGVSPCFVEVSDMECIDIDTEGDLEKAQGIYQYHKRNAL